MVNFTIPYIVILRPLNVLIAFVSVWIILAVSGSGLDAETALKSFLAALAAALICGGSNVINDYFDVEIDRINKPNRPIAAGLISKRSAIIYWACVSGVGVLLNLWVNGICLAIALFAVAALYFYSAYLKRTPLWGNLTVCFFTSLAFIYGGLAIGKIDKTLFPAMFTFIFQFGRELLKDVEDIEGDRRLSAKTFPVLFGIPKALVIVTISFFLLIVVTAWAYLSGQFSMRYFSVVIVGLYPIIGFTLIGMWMDSSAEKVNRLNQWLKLGMIVGLAAIYVG